MPGVTRDTDPLTRRRVLALGTAGLAVVTAGCGVPENGGDGEDGDDEENGGDGEDGDDEENGGDGEDEEDDGGLESGEDPSLRRPVGDR
jgi:hypothetical protein